MQHLFLALFILATTVCHSALANDIVLGVDREEIYGPQLSHKRVGIMVNQSSLNKEGRHTLDKLLAEQEKYQFTLTTIFSVEHGLRGNAETGLGDNNHLDAKTGLPIISLYGKDADGRARAHPTQEQLSNVDIVIYDLQDVGVRFYTYTISLHHMLESVQQYHKQMMIFDRPNPLGKYVYGPIMEEKNISGIGMHPVPWVHGLTSGEFARMIVGEGWLTHFDDASWKAFGNPAYQLPANDLMVISMANYRHDLPYSLPVRPSPNLRSDLSIKLYPSLGLFEATSVNTGRGSEHPFEQLGFPSRHFYVNTCYHVDSYQQKLGWPQAGKEVCGERFNAAQQSAFAPSIRHFIDWRMRFKEGGYLLQIDPQQESHYLDYQEKAFLLRPTWLAKLTGTSELPSLLAQADEKKLTVDETVALIESHWQPGIDAYLKKRGKYTLYP